METAMNPMSIELTRMFGSDAAIGITVHVAGDFAPMSATEFETFKAQNPGFAESGHYSMVMPDGSSTVVCTNYARHIKRTLPGRVVVAGFFCDENPDCTFSRRDYAEGHDFALVDDRFLVDPWMKLVYLDTDPIVYDLHSPADEAAATAMYGPRTSWQLEAAA